VAEIVSLAVAKRLVYMMAETVVHAREYLYLKELLDAWKLGKLQFVQTSRASTGRRSP
jgi:predicted dehydrogenase